MFWIIEIKLPVTKVSILGKLLKKENNFAGMNIINDTFKNNLATVQIRIKSTEESRESKYPPFMIRLLQWFGGRIYHTPKNKDTWEYAHKPAAYKRPNISKKYQMNALQMSKKAVLVFGKDTDDELLQIMLMKNALVEKGYTKSTFMKAIGDVPNKSLTQKVQFWAVTCRFCIMMDLKPAGHLTEYPILKNLDVILAIIRPKNYRSTNMIDVIPTNQLIRIFEFEKSPLECLEEVIQWAEGITRKNESYYNNHYEWRKPNDS